MKKKTGLLLFVVVAVSLLWMPSCKQCKKDEAKNSTADTSALNATSLSNAINLPHADTSLIPVLAKVLDDAFDASRKKDYAKLASLLVYRGADSTRYGYDVFTTKTVQEKKLLKITADVFNKWNGIAESKDYSRVFELDQPDGRKLPVLEVIFVSKKSVDRKFFGFLKIKDDYKIADVTSYL